MFPIAAVVEMDQTTIIVISGLVTAIGVLVSVIGVGFSNQIKDLTAQLAAQSADTSLKITNLSNRAEAQRAELEAKIASLEAKTSSRHQETTVKLFDLLTTNQKENLAEAKNLQQQISDVNVSVAGFSGNFVTRREFEESKE